MESKHEYKCSEKEPLSVVFPVGPKSPAGRAQLVFHCFKKTTAINDLNKTVRAVAAVQGVGLALRGAHEPAHCSGRVAVGLCSKGGPQEPRGEGTTPLPPSPFLALFPTFYMSTCAISTATLERFFLLEYSRRHYSR